jgi:hypothetical protein
MFKPTATGGLSYILVPKDFTAEDFPYEPDEVTEWIQVHDLEMV